MVPNLAHFPFLPEYFELSGFREARRTADRHGAINEARASEQPPSNRFALRLQRVKVRRSLG